ncbi:FG-GAP repeat domain-containing protein [Tahibacter amnicola]|uniref:VCBS repeat-containing protein n=1 Tax=Tahibacter amnicola TaxID=2976241 RepID=A0ABY6BK82_9GAMM|nr:VCBS repeat-containing protein [Tahibacter amnicola]UXI70172.1 VCBS repeat-containing protein [Tahibacter amnicola]
MTIRHLFPAAALLFAAPSLWAAPAPYSQGFRHLLPWAEHAEPDVEIIYGGVDLDGDQRRDVVIAARSQPLTLMSNVAPGRFVARNLGTYETAVSFLAAAHFNNDPWIDLFLSDGRSSRVLFGQGAGLFVPGPHLSLGADAMALVDFNGDGVLDMVGTENGITELALGQGNGAFQYGGSTSAYSGIPYVSTADVTGDNRKDLLSGAGAGVSLVRYQPGSPSMVRTDLSLNFNDDRIVQHLHATDLDRDTKPDALVGTVDLARNSTLHVLANRLGAPSYLTMLATSYPLVGLFTEEVTHSITGLQATDYNRDGNPDAVVGLYADGCRPGKFRPNWDEACPSVALFPGNGNATLGVPVTINGGELPKGGVVADDFDDDGITDFAFFSTRRSAFVAYFTDLAQDQIWGDGFSEVWVSER